MKLNLPTPIHNIEFEGRAIYLKRDDLISHDFSGNKARKFYYFLSNDFNEVKKVISHGSSQSNAMYSLSVLAKARGWRCEYYVDHISSHLISNPHGNYAGALKNGMNIVEGETPARDSLSKDTIFIDEGGRQAEAEQGIKILADEIIQWTEQKCIDKLNIFLPSGTGTTALFLQANLPKHFTVYTNACVGGDEYLSLQFESLNSDISQHPKILSLGKKFHFGKLYKENWDIWLKLKEKLDIEFDLLYDPLGWRVMLSHKELFDTPVLYIHQGGVLGNKSMKPRYERKYSKDRGL